MKAAWAGMTALASLVAAYALMVLVLPGFGPPFMRALRDTVPLFVVAHLAGGLTALAIAPWQLNARLRTRALHVHRWLGRVYVVAVAIGGISAVGLARTSQHGVVTHAGFGLLGVLWVACTMQGYRSIRRGDDATHRRWMIRSIALTLAAVTLRIYLPIEQAAGIPFPTAYRVVSWACWVPNLAAAEWWIRRSPRRAAPAYTAA